MTKLDAMIEMLSAALKIAQEEENKMLVYLIGMALQDARGQRDGLKASAVA